MRLFAYRATAGLRRWTVATACAVPLVLLAGAVPAPAAYQLDRSWGGRGTDGAGQLEFDFPAGILPAGIAVDPFGAIYVADEGYDQQYPRIVRFDAEGNYLGEVGAGAPGGRFSPKGVATDSFGSIYVADVSVPWRILKLDPAGAVLEEWTARQWAPEGEDPQYIAPEGVAVDASGSHVYVTSYWAGSVTDYAWSADDSTYSPEATWGSSGQGEGQLSFPLGVAIDPAGTGLYVADTDNDRLQRLDWGTGGQVSWMAWGESGSGNGQLDKPVGVAADPAGDVFVADYRNDRVVKLRPGPEGVESWETFGESGSGEGQLDRPGGVAVDSQGAVYVLDMGNARVQKWVVGGPTVEEPKEPEVTVAESAVAETAAESSASAQSSAGGSEPATLAEIALEISSPRLTAGKARRLGTKTLARYLKGGFRGRAEPASGIRKIRASIVRKRGGRCYRIEAPSKRTSCSRTSSSGLRTSSSGTGMGLLYRPLARGSSLRHSASAKRLLRKMRRGEVLRKGSYLLSFAIYPSSGAATTFTYKLEVS